MRRLLLTATALCGSLVPLRAGELIPIVDGEVLGGETFLDGKDSSWEGNARIQASPAYKFDESWTVLPTYSGSYQGTKSVLDLAGGSQLFQDSQSHSLMAKLLYSLGPWRFKPGAGYRWDFLRETADETWGHGLFDFRKPSGGLEVDYVFTPNLKLNGEFDYYQIRFPNYSSLESQAAPNLGREQAEVHALDTRNYSWTWGGKFPLPFEGGFGDVSFNVTQRYYPEQHVVADTGQLGGGLRIDDIRSVSGTAGWGHGFSEHVAAVFTLASSYARYNSNQNHYDAELNLFNPNYYSYEEVSVSPKLALIFSARKVESSISYVRIQRDYLARLAQDASGSYLGETTRLTQDTFLFDLTIPIALGFKLVARTGVSNSSSNMLFENTFKYNYTLVSQMVGASYAY